MKKNSVQISKELLTSIQKIIGFFIGFYLLLFVLPNFYLIYTENEIVKGTNPTTLIIITVALLAIAITAIVVIQNSKKNCKSSNNNSPESKVSDTTVKVLNNYVVGFKFWRVLLVVLIILVSLFVFFMLF